MKNLLPVFVRKRLDPAERYGLRLTLFVLALSLVALPFSWLLIQVSSSRGIVSYDTALAKRVFEYKLDHPWIATVMNAISFLGWPPWFWMLIGGVALYLFKKNQKRLAAYLLSCTIGGSIVNTFVKVTVDRPRPTFRDPSAITFQRGKSFPSGHTMSSTIAYGALLLIFLPVIPKKYRTAVRIAVLTLVILIGFSRLALGVHYLSDVIGGFVLGAAWLVAATAAFEIWRSERGRPVTEPLTEGLEPEAKKSLTPGAGTGS